MIERPFTISLQDETKIRGDLRLPEGEPPLSAIVVAHGVKGFKDWGFFPTFASVWRGMATLSFRSTFR